MVNAHGLFVLANCYTLAGFIFPGGSDHINWEFIMWVEIIYKLNIIVLAVSNSRVDYILSVSANISIYALIMAHTFSLFVLILAIQ